MSGPDTLTRDDDIDVVGIFAALKRKWWLVLLVTLLAGAALLFVLSIISPRYDSSARILVRDGDTTFTRATGDNSNQLALPRFDEQAVRSEVEVIGSNKLIFEVIDALDLSKLEEFEGDEDYLDVRKRVLEFAGQEERLEPARRTTAEDEARNQALRIFKERLNVYAVEQSRVIVIEFWSHNPELAQMIVAQLSERYVKKKLNAEIENSEDAVGRLDPRIALLEADVLKTEEAVAKFKSESDILQTDNNNGLLATQQLSEVSTELSRLKTERASAQAKAASIRAALANGSSLDVIPEVIESPLIQRLREREVELRASISDLSTTLLPNHPRMKALNSQLKDFESQIRAAANNIVASLENNVSLARQSEQDLEKEIVELKAKASEVDQKLITLRALEREADTAKTLLTEYKSRSLEAKSRSDLARGDAEIISPASLADKPFFPKIIPFTIAGMVAAALLTTLAIIAFSLLSAVGAAHGERTPSHRDKAIEPSLDEEKVVTAQASDAEEETHSVKPKRRNHFKELEAVLRRNRNNAPSDGDDDQQNGSVDAETGHGETGNPGHSGPIAIRHAAKVFADLGQANISVLCPGGELGSSTSWLLARKLSSMKKSVVLIDLAGGAVCTRKLLGAQGEYPGIFNLMTGAVGVDAILHKDRGSDVTVIPAGSLFAEAETMNVGYLAELIEAISSSFDFCIVDYGDAEASEVELVAPADAVQVISCIKTDEAHVELLEADLQALGFEEIVRLSPDRVDIGKVREDA